MLPILIFLSGTLAKDILAVSLFLRRRENRLADQVMRLFNAAVFTLFSSALLCASSLTIPNFNFETPNLSTGTLGGCSGSPTGGIYIYNPTGCGQAWTFLGDSGLTRTPSAFNNPLGPDGSAQSAFLQKEGSFSQTIDGIDIGSPYTLSFWAIQRTCCDGSFGQTISVNFGGADLTFDNSPSTSVHPGTAEWTEYTTDVFIAQSNTAVLQFSGHYVTDATAFIGCSPLPGRRSQGLSSCWHRGFSL